MEDLQSIVLLIDADNTQLSKLEDIIREISTHGRIVVKRAYGNWKKDVLKNWEEEIKRLAIKAEQQFDYVSGKNATDMALVIDTISLLHRGIYDAFVIVASDSDYTPLAIHLHESGVHVIGVGEKKTPISFRNSCDEFIFLENLGAEKKSRSTALPGPRRKNKDTAENNVDVSTEQDEPEESINWVHDLLREASDRYQDDDGYVNVSSAGQFIKRVKPDFDVRSFGFLKLPKLIEAFPDRYEMIKYPGKGKVKIVAYRVK
ncbi:MAG: NYN domain-containing protein [Succiniclasticum sp.]|mgnify:CR=1 FL=1|nr:NYN domain-containing protein [Succiniclasticum sp.]MDY6087194.1 NYN domain-containing protein [Succiniclasticum sp.]